MGQTRPNSGSVWATKNFDDENAKCHFSGDALIGDVEYKLFGRKAGREREMDFVQGGHTVASCTMKPVEDRKSEKYPHYRGTLFVQDGGWEVSGWAKVIDTKHGPRKMLSLAFKAMQKKEESKGDSPTDTASVDDMPF